MNSPFDDPLFLQRTLSGFAAGYTGLARLFGSGPGAGQFDPNAIQQAMAAHYQALFLPPGTAAPVTPAGTASGAAWVKYQEAAGRWGTLFAAIAQDASRRFAEALADDGSDAPRITSLRELHALWIECGESAYHAAAHREDFAEAQAALVGALAELAAGMPRA